MIRIDEKSILSLLFIISFLIALLMKYYLELIKFNIFSDNIAFVVNVMVMNPLTMFSNSCLNNDIKFIIPVLNISAGNLQLKIRNFP